MSGNPSMAGIVLAGGRASRMGGGDKGLLLLDGRTLLAGIVDRLAPQVGWLAINANGDPDRWSTLGLEVVADTLPGQPGPLAGVLAGLEHAAGIDGCEALLTVPSDTPFLPSDLARRMNAALANSPPGAIAVASSDTGDHPVVALWPLSLRGRLRRHLVDGGDRSVRSFLGDVGRVDVPFPSLVIAGRTIDPFFNINEPRDLAEAQAIVESLKA